MSNSVQYFTAFGEITDHSINLDKQNSLLKKKLPRLASHDIRISSFSIDYGAVFSMKRKSSIRNSVSKFLEEYLLKSINDEHTINICYSSIPGVLLLLHYHQQNCTRFYNWWCWSAIKKFTLCIVSERFSFVVDSLAWKERVGIQKSFTEFHFVQNSRFVHLPVSKF